MYIIDSSKENEKIFITTIKKGYENDPFLTQEQIDVLVQKLKAIIE